MGLALPLPQPKMNLLQWYLFDMVSVMPLRVNLLPASSNQGSRKCRYLCESRTKINLHTQFLNRQVARGEISRTINDDKNVIKHSPTMSFLKKHSHKLQKSDNKC